ncbi:sugar transferase [Paeniroseomonas aquatica]|uniref:sugar transferase n=1 Tax=Paeniroseomonas aquatica TaxID=373043 RepID=UPI00361E5BB2
MGPLRRGCPHRRPAAGSAAGAAAADPAGQPGGAARRPGDRRGRSRAAGPADAGRPAGCGADRLPLAARPLPDRRGRRLRPCRALRQPQGGARRAGRAHPGRRRAVARGHGARRPGLLPPALALFWLAFATPPLLSGRLAAALALRAAADRTRQRAVVVGDGPQASRFVAALRGRQDRSIELLGLVDDRRPHQPRGHRNGLPYLGSIEQLCAMIRRGEVDQIILALPWAAEARLVALLRLFGDYPVDIRLAPDLMAYRSAGQAGPEAERLRLLRLADRPIRGWGAVVKSIEDYLLAGIGLAVAAAPMALIALAIKLDSPGPVFFRQRRTGFNNTHFYVLKFRTMYNDALDHTVKKQVSAGDARVTRVGAILRRTSLDELPQILNVLRGEMSFIGPRPHAPGTRAGGRPSRRWPSATPPATGSSRASPAWPRSAAGAARPRRKKLIRRVESDLEYIDTWSPWLDLTILVRTLLAVARMRNAC